MQFIDIHGHKIPGLGFGTWQLKDKDCETGVRLALETGYRHIDTAQVYENEEAVGRALRDSGVARKDIFLTTKVWITNLKPGQFLKSVDESLRKLGTDHVDLLLIHWPVTNEISFAEQLKSLRAAQEEGKTKLIGVSNFTVAQMQEVKETLDAPVVNNQVEYHPFLSQRPVLDFVRRHDMFLTAYSPLARGKVRGDKTIAAIAKKHGKNEGQIALRWLLQQERVAAIPKAASKEHIRGNFDIFSFKLDDADMKALDGLARTDGRIVSPDWAPKWDKAA